MSIIDTIQHFAIYAKSNPVLAGVISLWGMGVVTFLFRHLPAKLWNNIKGQFTTRLYFDNSPRGTNLETYISFLSWFEGNKWAKYSRSLSINGKYTDNFGNENSNDGVQTGIGEGSHIFFYKRRLCWMRRSKVENIMAYNGVNYEIVITALSRNRRLILDMIGEFSYKPHENRVGIYNFKNDDWHFLTDAENRSLESVIMNSDVKSDIIRQIESFRQSETWYKKRGIPYKRVFLFHGITGTGKTSAIRALASYFKANIYRLNLSNLADSGLESALANAPRKSFILIEDFDSSKSTKSREHKDEFFIKKPDGDDKKEFLTLSGILNALDGIVALDDKIVFMTTNVLSSVDSALIRKGRVDCIVEFKALTNKEVREYITFVFPDVLVNPDILFENILGCDLQDLYMQNPDDSAQFLDSIPKKVINNVISINS